MMTKRLRNLSSYSIILISIKSSSLPNINSMLKNWMRLSERKVSHQLHALVKWNKVRDSRSMRHSSRANIESWFVQIFSEEVSMLRRSMLSLISTCQLKLISIFIELEELVDLEPRVWQFHSYHRKKITKFLKKFKKDLRSKSKSCQPLLINHTTWITETYCLNI